MWYITTNMSIKWEDIIWFFCLIGFSTSCNLKAQRSVKTKPALAAVIVTEPEPPTCEDGTVTFSVYSRGIQNGLQIDSNNLQHFQQFRFKPKSKLKVIVHGWKSSGQESWVYDIKNAYLSREECNVVVVDWSTLASCSNYLKSRRKTTHVGQETAKLLDYLLDEGLVEADGIHIIGHSLGGHVAGIAGSSTKVLIGRITGLDIAKPGYGLVLNKADYLDTMDAQFVDAIHTTAGITGWAGPVGHADFYPNRGVTPQPGCSRADLISSDNVMSYSDAAMETVICSHSRAYVLFLESISNKTFFKAVKCPWDLTQTFEKCDPNAEIEMMGDHCSHRARGTFYLETNSFSPFAKENNVNKTSK